jgi:hypothetical protein
MKESSHTTKNNSDEQKLKIILVIYSLVIGKDIPTRHVLLKYRPLYLKELASERHTIDPTLCQFNPIHPKDEICCTFTSWFSVPPGKYQVLTLSHGRFLPNPFQFITHLSFYHSVFYSTTADNIVK